MIPEWLRHIVPRTDRQPNASGPCIVAFGKHPAWDDHLAEEGHWTPGLRDLKDWLYVRGIAGCIDRGLWDPHTLGVSPTPFNHILVWQRTADSIAAIVWASADAKGRNRYPMVVAASVPRYAVQDREAAQCPHAHEDMLDAALRHLAGLRESCLGLGEPPAVMLAVRNASLELASRLAQSPRKALPVVQRSIESIRLSQIAQGRPPHSHDTLRAIAIHAARGLSRLSQVEGLPESHSAFHLRVPLLSHAALGESGRAWVSVLGGLLADVDPQGDRLSIEAPDEGVVDLVFGSPRPEHAALLGMPRLVEPTADTIPVGEVDEQTQLAVRGLLQQTRPA